MQSATETHYNLIAVTDDSKKIKRVQEICEEFDFTYKVYGSVDELNDFEKSNFVLVFPSKNTQNEMSGSVQVVKYYNPSSFVIAFVDNTVDQEASEFIKKSGANIVLFENEIFDNSKVEFLSIQIIKTTFIPVKVSELKVNTKIPFSVFYMMPINRRYLKSNQPDFMVTDEWKKKIESKVTEVYVHRDETHAYYEYLSSCKDLTAEGVNARCRAAFLDLQQSFVELVILLSDNTETQSFAQGKQTLQNCSKICSDLLSIICTIGDPLTVINNIIEGDFGSVERSPGQAAIAGVMALNTDLNTQKVMLATLISNLGLIMLPYSICKKIKEEKISELSKEDLQRYHRHPISSINLALAKKLPLDDEVKDIIMCSHERLDQKGFPNQILPERISEESQLLQFNEELDFRCVVRMGKPRKIMKSEFDRMILEYESKQKYSPFFINKVKDAI